LKGPQHFSIGLLSAGAALSAARLFGADVGVVAIGTGAVVAGLGALAPDIDHPRSLIASRIPGRAIRAAARVALPLVALAAVAGYFAGERAGASLLRTFSPMLHWALIVAVGAVALGVGSVAASRTLGHRGPVHSVAVGALASGAVAVGFASLGLPVWYAGAFGWGWLTHLLADMTTRDGLPAGLWPIAGSGGIMELLVGDRSRSMAGLALRLLVLASIVAFLLGAGRSLLAVAGVVR
jgi:membrane-bound metal-dependent hydrolase YbcI (DUF457 family)